MVDFDTLWWTSLGITYVLPIFSYPFLSYLSTSIYYIAVFVNVICFRIYLFFSYITVVFSVYFLLFSLIILGRLE